MKTPESPDNMENNKKPVDNTPLENEAKPKRKRKTNKEKVYESFEQYLEKIEGQNSLTDEKSFEDKLYKTYYRREVTSETEANQIANIAGEFLEDFFIVGHNFKGDRIKIYKAQNRKDKDSLNEAIREAVMPIIFTEM